MATNVDAAVLNAGVQITTGAVAYITGGANTKTVIRRAVFNNITGGAVTITVRRTPSGGGALDLITARPVAASGTDLAPELANMVLNGGDTISCLASANTAINFFASGFVTS